MKIIQNNMVIAAPAYPKNYTCQWCASVIQIETATDINRSITVKEPTTKEPNRTVLALGFNCPVCHKDNITG